MSSSDESSETGVAAASPGVRTEDDDDEDGLRIFAHVSFNVKSPSVAILVVAGSYGNVVMRRKKDGGAGI